MNRLRLILELTKAKITLAVTLSVATGHLLYAEAFTLDLILPLSGVFLLACGSSALNQVQEARIDARMTRTKSRPVPSGRIRADWALFIALALVGFGLFLLASIPRHTLTVLALAGFALVWYNGVYTYLKRLTAFAVVPGALVGAVPPVIGWVSAGGVVYDSTIFWVAFFFFMWQIPHFWLLLLIHGKDYEEAGLPSLTRIFSMGQIGRITCMWILSTATAGILLGVMIGVRPPWSLVLLLASVWLCWRAIGLLRAERESFPFVPAFVRINVYTLLVMICLAGDALTQ